MTARQQWGVVATVVALLGIGLWGATRFLGDELFPVTIGSQAPAFTATVVDSGPPRERTLADYRGRVVLLNVWATWCLPCREEMPSMQALHESFADDGLAIVAVSIDDPGSERAIRDFAAEYALTFDILHNPEGDIRRIYQTTGVPETFLIDAGGRIVRKQIGATDWNSSGNRALIAGLLGVDGASRGTTPGIFGDTAVSPSVDTAVDTSTDTAVDTSVDR